MLNVRTLTRLARPLTATGEPDYSRLILSGDGPPVSSTLTGLSQQRHCNCRCEPSSETAAPATADPWSRTLAALLQFSASSDELFPTTAVQNIGTRHRTAHRVGAQSRTFTVTVLEAHAELSCMSFLARFDPLQLRRTGMDASSCSPLRAMRSIRRVHQQRRRGLSPKCARWGAACER